VKENFDRAFQLVIGAEGGYVNDPSDAGGETKYGISKRAYPDTDIKSLTLDDAKEIYKQDYWNAVQGDDLPDRLDIVMFDCAVNQGVGAARKLYADDYRTFLRNRLKNYSRIVQNNPTQLKFLRGWVNRVIDLWEKVEA